MLLQGVLRIPPLTDVSNDALDVERPACGIAHQGQVDLDGHGRSVLGAKRGRVDADPRSFQQGLAPSQDFREPLWIHRVGDGFPDKLFDRVADHLGAALIHRPVHEIEVEDEHAVA